MTTDAVFFFQESCQFLCCRLIIVIEVKNTLLAVLKSSATANFINEQFVGIYTVNIGVLRITGLYRLCFACCFLCYLIVDTCINFLLMHCPEELRNELISYIINVIGRKITVSV